MTLTRARLRILKGRSELGAPRLEDLDQVVLCGNVQVTTQALRALLHHKVELAFLNMGGRFLGRLSTRTGGNVELRRTQHRHLDDPAAVLDLARRYVAGKLQASRRLLQRHQRRRPNERIARALVSIRLMAERLPSAPDLDTLRGLEGQSAAAYFGAFDALLHADGVTFTGRKRRPPPDPVNILLSFGYTLLAHRIEGLCELAGLDPHLGSLHATAYGRPSLALDLMEEMRSTVVDTAVLRAFNTKALRPQDFVPTDLEDAPVEEAWERAERDAPDAPAPRRKLVLTQQGARRWFVAFDRRLDELVTYPSQGRRLSYRQILREQVYLLARHLRGEQQYESFVPP